MTVYKRDNGKWYCKFTIRGVTKHLLCAGATTEKEALEIENAFKYKLQQQINGVMPKEHKNVYFNRLKELYIKHAKTNNARFLFSPSSCLILLKYKPKLIFLSIFTPFYTFFAFFICIVVVECCLATKTTASTFDASILESMAALADGKSNIT